MPRKRIHPRKDRLKTGVSGARFRKDDAFKNSRRAASDFGHASQCAVLIRREFMSMLEGRRQNEMHKKLTKIIGVLIRERRLTGAARIRLNDLDWKRLGRVHFNEEAGLGTMLLDTTGVEVNAATGSVIIRHPSFNIAGEVKSDSSVSHVRIIAGAATIDFDRKTTCHDYSATEYLSRDLPPQTTIDLTLQLPAPIVHPLFIVLGLLSFKPIGNKEFYEMPGRRHRALDLIYVHTAPLIADKPGPRTAKKPASKAVKKKPVKKPRPAKKKRRR